MSALALSGSDVLSMSTWKAILRCYHWRVSMVTQGTLSIVSYLKAGSVSFGNIKWNIASFVGEVMLVKKTYPLPQG